MKFWKKCKIRFLGSTITLDISDHDLAWFLQMGWVEKVFGRYIITEHGEAALEHVMRTMEDKSGY